MLKIISNAMVLDRVIVGNLKETITIRSRNFNESFGSRQRVD